MNRRHDIDALRVLAFSLVILYHVAMYYVAGWGWHLKSPDAVEWLQWPMRALNLWRMELVFLISGLAIGFLRRGQSRAVLLRSRTLRLLLPLAFGMAVVVPFQPYAQMLAAGLVPPGFGNFLLRYFAGGPWPRAAFDGSAFGVTWNHLWYLPYLWAYTTVLVLLLPLLESPAGLWLRHAFLRLRSARLLLLPVLPLLVYSLALWPRFPVTHDLIHDGWLHAVDFTLFLYGWWIGVDEGLWTEAARLRWTTLGVAGLLLALLFGLRALGIAETGSGRQALRTVADFYLWSMVLAILGWGHRKLNRPWRWLPWANESVYPWYLLHQTVLIVLIVGLAPLRLHPAFEASLLLGGTVLGCWGITSAVRRNDWLRPLFGLRRRAPFRRRPSATPGCPAAHNAG